MNAEAHLRAATTGITAEDELTEDGDKLLLENDDNQELESNLVFGDWVPLRNGHFQGRLFSVQVRAEQLITSTKRRCWMSWALRPRCC